MSLDEASEKAPYRLQILGGGRMGEAIIGGLLASGWAAASELLVVEAVASRRTELEGKFPGLSVSPSPGEVSDLLVAVKPADVAAAMGEVRAVAGDRLKRLVSVAAGVSIDTLERLAGDRVGVVRAMPNTPALVGAGASALAAGTRAGEAELEWAEDILGAVGTVVRVSEPTLDAVTGLSGSGPAYVFLVAEALVEAGVLVGLSRALSEQLVGQTLLGAARLLTESEPGVTASDLRAAVTSPGGTTAAGLRALEQHGVRSAMLDAVVAAVTRSKEMHQ